MKELRRFGKKSYTVVEILTADEVRQLTHIINELINICNEDNNTADKIEKVQGLFIHFNVEFGANYAIDTWENIYINDDESSEISSTKAEYKPFTYLRCVYSVFDTILNDTIDFNDVVEYFADLDKLITYKLT